MCSGEGRGGGRVILNPPPLPKAVNWTNLYSSSLLLGSPHLTCAYSCTVSIPLQHMYCSFRQCCVATFLVNTQCRLYAIHVVAMKWNISVDSLTCVTNLLRGALVYPYCFLRLYSENSGPFSRCNFVWFVPRDYQYWPFQLPLVSLRYCGEIHSHLSSSHFEAPAQKKVSVLKTARARTIV